MILLLLSDYVMIVRQLYIRRAKGNFLQDYLENDIISVKKLWEKINYLLPSASSGSSFQLIDNANNTHVTVEQTPRFINEFFHKYRA